MGLYSGRGAYILAVNDQHLFYGLIINCSAPLLLIPQVGTGKYWATVTHAVIGKLHYS